VTDRVKRPWQIHRANPDVANRLARAVGVSAVAGQLLVNRDLTDPAAARVEAKEPSPLEAARRWHMSAPRVSADNRGQLMEELQGHLRKLPACKLDLAKLSAQARMDEFGGWLKAQAVPA
jgi:hypothetical protein